MNIHWRSEVRRTFLPLTACLVTISFYGAAQSPPVTPGTTTRTRISENIDSLDLVKQNLKRQGFPIAEIEQQQDILRDSLKALRQRLEITPKSVSRSTPDILLSKFLNKPANLFDWIIVITGIVALFSGIMLFIGVTRIFSGKRRRRRRTPETIRQAKTPAVEKTYQPSPAYPDSTPEPVPPPVTKSPTSTDVGVTQLRRRIEKYQITPGMYDTPHIPELPPVPEPQPSGEEADERSIESRVVAASRSGLDIPAISRKFQLSADHVALILKMAGHTPSSR